MQISNIQNNLGDTINSHINPSIQSKQGQGRVYGEVYSTKGSFPDKLQIYMEIGIGPSTQFRFCPTSHCQTRFFNHLAPWPFATRNQKFGIFSQIIYYNPVKFPKKKMKKGKEIFFYGRFVL